MPLRLSAQPGFTDIPDDSFDATNPITATVAKALNSDAKLASVRNEQFWGYYRNGETVALPVSPADGYQYSRNELLYIWTRYGSSAAPNPCNGTQTPPTRGAGSGAGELLFFGDNIDQATGAVTCNTSYYKPGGSQTDTNDGILLVIALAQRLRG